MREELWPNGQHRIQPLTCGQYSKITATGLHFMMRRNVF